MRYVISLGYDGTQFCGWQHQPSGRSVQDAVRSALRALTGEDAQVVGSGRTDAGVHALCQVAHFDLDKTVPTHTVVSGLNAYLPKTVRVLSAAVAADGFDARKTAKKKTYMYLMYTATPQPVLADRVMFTGALDVASMAREAQKLIGAHDFASFMATGSSAKTSTRTVFDAHFETDGAFIKFFITADGFLYNMVRIIAAQLVKIGKGENIDLGEIMEKRNRAAAKEVAPGCGLYLYSVDYGDVKFGGGEA